MKQLASFASIVALVAGLVASHGATQNHPNGYAAGIINFSKTVTEGTVLIYNPSTMTTVTVPAGSNNTHGLCMDHNNTLLMATDLTWLSSAPSVHMIDPVAGVNVGTLATFPTGVSLRDITVGQNGNYYVTETNTDVVYKVTQGGNVTTLAVVGNNPWGGIEIDINSSELMVQLTLNASADALILVDRNSSVVTTLGTGFDARYGMAYDLRNDIVYSSSGDVPTRIYSLNRGASNFAVRTTLSTLANGGPSGLYSMRADRSSAVFPQLLAGSCWTSCPGQTGGLYTLDISTGTPTSVGSPTITGVVTTLIPSASDIYDVEFLYRRNVHSNATGRGTWDIGIKIPEDAGKGYVLAVSATGVRGPGVPRFGSGRTAWLVADTVTFLGLGTGLAPFFTGDKGTLDGTGAAIAKLNMSAFSAAANGIRLWFLAVTLDQNAPDGIATITDPHIIKLEGL